MQTYIQYYERRTEKWNRDTNQFETVNAFYSEPCGTDSVFIPDGRKKIETQFKDAQDRMNIFNEYCNKSWAGFAIKVKTNGRFTDNDKIIKASFDISLIQ